MKTLHTLKQFRALKPKEQGYVSCMEGELPESELKDHQANPYPLRSREYFDFETGRQIALYEVPDQPAV